MCSSDLASRQGQARRSPTWCSVGAWCERIGYGWHQCPDQHMTRDARTRKRQCHTTLRSHVKHHSDICPHPHLLLTMTLRTIFKVGEPCLPFAYTSLQRLAPSILRQQIPSFVVLGVCYVGCPLSMVRVRFQVHFCTLQLTIVVQSFGYLCMSSRRVARRSSGFSLRATLTCLFNALQGCSLVQ